MSYAYGTAVATAAPCEDECPDSLEELEVVFKYGSLELAIKKSILDQYENGESENG